MKAEINLDSISLHTVDVNHSENREECSLWKEFIENSQYTAVIDIDSNKAYKEMIHWWTVMPSVVQTVTTNPVVSVLAPPLASLYLGISVVTSSLKLKK